MRLLKRLIPHVDADAHLDRWAILPFIGVYVGRFETALIVAVGPFSVEFVW